MLDSRNINDTEPIQTETNQSGQPKLQVTSQKLGHHKRFKSRDYTSNLLLQNLKGPGTASIVIQTRPLKQKTQSVSVTQGLERKPPKTAETNYLTTTKHNSRPSQQRKSYDCATFSGMTKGEQTFKNAFSSARKITDGSISELQSQSFSALNTQIPRSQDLAVKQRRLQIAKYNKILNKYKDHSDPDYVPTDHAQSLTNKIPLLEANMAFEIHRFSSQMKQRSRRDTGSELSSRHSQHHELTSNPQIVDYGRFKKTLPGKGREETKGKGILLSNSDYLQEASGRKIQVCKTMQDTSDTGRNQSFFHRKHQSQDYSAATGSSQRIKMQSSLDHTQQLDSIQSSKMMTTQSDFESEAKTKQHKMDIINRKHLESQHDYNCNLTIKQRGREPNQKRQTKNVPSMKLSQPVSKKSRIFREDAFAEEPKFKFEPKNQNVESERDDSMLRVTDGQMVQLLNQKSIQLDSNMSKNMPNYSQPINQQQHALKMRHLSESINNLQKKDFYGKESDIKILHRQTRIPTMLKGQSFKSKSDHKQLEFTFLNPTIAMNTNPEKVKPKQRRELDTNLFGRREHSQVAKKRDFIQQVQQKFKIDYAKSRKNVAIETRDPVPELKFNINKHVRKVKKVLRLLHQEAAEAEKFGKISNAMLIKRAQIEDYMMELGLKDLDEIWSESDASDGRVDEMEICLDNNVQERLHEALVDDSEKELLPFASTKANKLNSVKRTEIIADKFKADFDAELSDEEQVKNFKKLRSQKTKKVALIETIEISENQKCLSGRTSKEQQFYRASNIEEEVKTTTLHKKKTLRGNKDKKSILFALIAKMMKNQKVKSFEELESMEKNRSQVKVKRAKEIIKQMQTYEIGQQKHREAFSQMMGHEPNLVYMQAVDRDQQVPLSLLRKVQDGVLVLQDYTMDSGHLFGLAAAIKTNIDLHSVLFDNCGIDDEELAILLNGCLMLDRFQILAYKNNVFKEQGLAALKPVLQRKDPRNLHELRLVNCVTSPLIMVDLLQFMVREKVHVRKLSLVKMQIHKQSLEVVAQLLEDSEHLEDLDLSWNNLLPSDFSYIFQAIAKNRTLRSLNLSCNNIIDKNEQNNPIDFKFDSALQDYIERRKTAIFEGKSYIPKEKLSKENPMQFIYSFGRLIRYNRKITSLTLNNCGLNAQVIVGLVPYLRHAKSLLCLHLGSNPGISDEVKGYYKERLKILPEVHLQVKVEPENLGEIPLEKLANFSPKAIAMRYHKNKHKRDWMMEEVSKYTNTRRLKALYANSEVDLNTDGKDLTLTRYLGYKERMPGMGRWKIQTLAMKDSCWNCDNWIYTLYFWNEKIGRNNDRNYIGIERDKKEELVETIQELNKETYMCDKDVPVLFSSMNDWQPRPFMTVVDYLNTLQPVIYPPFERIAEDQAIMHFNLVDIGSAGEDIKSEVHEFIQQRKEEIKVEFFKIRYSTAVRVIKEQIAFKNPALVNFEQLNGDFGEVFVLPIFLPPGKIDFMIRTQQGVIDQVEESQTEDFRWHYRRFLSDIRTEQIPPFAKVLKIKQESIPFQKKFSVFKDWKEDTEKTFRDCFIHDTKYWKVKKICADYDTYNSVCDLIKLRYNDLMQIFMSAVITIGDTEMKKTAFLHFCQNAGITDKKMHSGIIDTYFKATNYEEQDQDNNDDNAIIRFEFFEILVRIAKGKYIDFGKEKLLTYSMMKLFQGHILPMRSSLFPLQSWRDEELWCIEVNELFTVNIRAIQKLYTLVASCAKFVRVKNRLEDNDLRVASIDQIRTVLMPATIILGIGDHTVYKAFYASKMTCVQETDNSNYEYTYLHKSEFYEFIGRLAQLKYMGTYQETQWGLGQKIQVVLKTILRLVGDTMIVPPESNEVISESDDDY